MVSTFRPFVLATLLVVGTPLLAQDRPVVFLHGVMSDGGTWTEAASRLESRLEIRPIRPNLSWSSFVENQASTLQSGYGSLPNSMVAVGHSLGGLVARQWARQRQMGGLITLGSPNFGAPAANHAGEWVGFNYNLFWAMANTFGAFGNTSPGLWSWAYLAAEAWLNWGGFLSDQALQHFVLELGIGLKTPFVQQVYVGSPFLDNLNGSFGREAAASRVAIVNTMSQYWRGGPWRLRYDADTAEQWSILTDVGAATLDYVAARVYVEADPLDYASQDLVSALLEASWWLWNFEEFWCRTVSDARPLYGGRCNPHDGFVPTVSQHLWGATVELENGAGPPHTGETRVFDDFIYAALTNVMHVLPRGEGSSGSGGSGDSGGTGGSGGSGGSGGGAVDTLASDQVLYPDASIVSADGRFSLLYQSDGNLVLYRFDGVPLWHTGTHGRSAGRTLMQSDGNLVIYDAAGVPIWASGTAGHAGARLVMQSDGNLVIYSAGGAPLWATNTWGY